MSVIIATGSAISRAALNTSSAKNMYTFAKASRFPTISRKGFSDTFYDLPSVRMKRTCTFGYGTKSDFTKNTRRYNPKFNDNSSDFGAKSHGPRYTFSNGREKYGKVYLDTNKLFDKFVPGPGKYDYLKPFGSDAPKYSMKGKYDKGLVKEPAPKYNTSYTEPCVSILAINPKGKYASSKVNNVNSIKMQYDKSRRSDWVTIQTPGPDKYNAVNMFGRIFVSNYFSNEGKSMAMKWKYKDSRSNYPGPGSYLVHSDFGQYQSKDADSYPKENVWPEKKIEFEEKAWRHNMKKPEPPKEENENEENNEDNQNYEDENKEEEKNNEEEHHEEEHKEEEHKEEEHKEEEHHEEETKGKEEETKGKEEEHKEEEPKKEEETKGKEEEHKEEEPKKEEETKGKEEETKGKEEEPKKEEEIKGKEEETKGKEEEPKKEEEIKGKEEETKGKEEEPKKEETEVKKEETKGKEEETKGKEETKTGEVKTEEPKKEEPKIEKPKAEEPKIEEPKKEETEVKKEETKGKEEETKGKEEQEKNVEGEKKVENKEEEKEDATPS